MPAIRDGPTRPGVRARHGAWREHARALAQEAGDRDGVTRAIEAALPDL